MVCMKAWTYLVHGDRIRPRSRHIARLIFVPDLHARFGCDIVLVYPKETSCRGGLLSYAISGRIGTQIEGRGDMNRSRE